MATSETNGNGRSVAPSGVYVHPDTGEQLVTQATEKFGNPQADAIQRLGFVYVGPAELKEANADGEKAELFAAPDPNAAPLADTSSNRKTVDQLEAELAAAKEREQKIAEAQKSEASLVDSKEETSSSAKSSARKGDK